MTKKFIIITLTIVLGIFGSKDTMAQQNSNSKTALVIIDIQNFYFPGGLLPLVEPEKAVLNAKKILDASRENNILVIHVKHNASSGAEIYDLVKPINGEKIITKDKANAFVGTDLLSFLNDHNIENLILCGMQTHMCLEAATRAASDYGFNCTVIEDACTTRDLTFNNVTVKAKDVHYSTLSTLKGTYADIKTSDEFIESLKE